MCHAYWVGWRCKLQIHLKIYFTLTMCFFFSFTSLVCFYFCACRLFIVVCLLFLFFYCWVDYSQSTQSCYKLFTSLLATHTWTSASICFLHQHTNTATHTYLRAFLHNLSLCLPVLMTSYAPLRPLSAQSCP